MRRRLFALAFALPIASSARAGVRVVDSSGAGDFLDVQAAIDASVDGDVVLLRRPPMVTAERFGSARIAGKSLTLVGIETDRAPLLNVIVEDLPSGAVVVLAHLDVGFVYGNLPSNLRASILLDSNAGSVRIEDCRAVGRDMFSCDPVTTRPALSLRACDDVVVSGGSFTGGTPLLENVEEGADAIVIAGSRATIHSAAITGGAGGGPFAISCYGPTRDGGDGVRVLGGFLYLAGCTIAGGRGGESQEFFFPAIGGDGGAGIDVAPGADVLSRATTITGGAGGVGTLANGNPGPDVVGTMTVVAGVALNLDVRAHAMDGSGSHAVTLSGEPGDDAYLLVSRATTSTFVGASAGVLHARPPIAQRISLGAVPASGELSTLVALPDALADAPRRMFLQSAFVRAGGELRFGEARHVAVIDDTDDPCWLAPGTTRRVHVDASAAPGGDGSSWTSAFSDLRVALHAAKGCAEHPAEVWVATGTYRPAPPGGVPSRSFVLWSGTHVYGGFAGGETELAQRNVVANPVQLDGDLNGDDAPSFVNYGDNSYHVVAAGSGAGPVRNVRLDGVRVRGGRAGGGGANENGAGIRLHGSGDIVRCVVADCWGNNGTGVFAKGGDITLVSSRLFGNRCTFPGGGLTAIAHEGPIVVTNTLIAGNIAFYGGGAALLEGDVSLLGCTVYANESHQYPGGVVVKGSGPRIANTILWGNTSVWTTDLVSVQLVAPAGWSALRYSCLESYTGASGYVAVQALDPSFLDAQGLDGIAGTEDDDLRLGAGSPSVDAGEVASVPSDALDLDGDGDLTERLPHDLSGRARIFDDPAAPDTGSGGPPVVDIGAHERRP